MILGGGFAGVAAARRLERLRAVALVFGYRLTGFPAWWLRRFRPDITKVDIAPPSIPLEPAAYFDIPQTRVASG